MNLSSFWELKTFVYRPDQVFLSIVNMRLILVCALSPSILRVCARVFNLRLIILYRQTRLLVVKRGWEGRVWFVTWTASNFQRCLVVHPMCNAHDHHSVLITFSHPPAYNQNLSVWAQLNPLASGRCFYCIL